MAKEIVAHIPEMKKDWIIILVNLMEKNPKEAGIDMNIVPKKERLESLWKNWITYSKLQIYQNLVQNFNNTDIMTEFNREDVFMKG